MLFLTTLTAFMLCLAATPLVRVMAVRMNWMAIPTKERWHKKPTPFCGGIAIFVGMAVPLFYFVDFSDVAPLLSNSTIPFRSPSFEAVLITGVFFLFALGLVDDFIQIKPHAKLIGQIVVATMVAFLGFRLGWFNSLTLDTMITIFWIVGITNAFNLIDNTDGQCAGIALIASLFIAFLTFDSMPGTARIALILAGSTAAFLLFNFYPASIFMGDCGSLPVGFVLAMLTLHTSSTLLGTALESIAVPIMILIVPIFDTVMVTLIRMLSGRKASVGGKDHISHRLVIVGLSETKAVLFLYMISAVSGMAALFVSWNDSLSSPAVIIPLAVTIILIGVYLAQISVYPEGDFTRLKNRAFTPLLIDLTHRRQIMLVILDFCLIAFSYYLAYRLRFDSAKFSFFFKSFLQSLPAVVACKLMVFYLSGVYRSLWGFMGMSDVLKYLKATFLASLVSIAAVTYIYRFEHFSKGVFLIDWLLTTGFLLGGRGSFRLFTHAVRRNKLSGDRVFIYGAGSRGRILLHQLLSDNELQMKPVGFIDDAPQKVGKTFLDYPILGSSEDLEALCSKYRVKGLLISFEKSESDKIDRVKKFCKDNDLFLSEFMIRLKDVRL